MSEPLSEAELVEIEARAKAAHEGPWELRSETPSGLIWSVRCRKKSDGTPGNLILSGHRPICEFVQHSREDVPRLIAEVRRLRAERDEARALAGHFFALLHECADMEKGYRYQIQHPWLKESEQ